PPWRATPSGSSTTPPRPPPASPHPGPHGCGGNTPTEDPSPASPATSTPPARPPTNSPPGPTARTHDPGPSTRHRPGPGGWPWRPTGPVAPSASVSPPRDARSAAITIVTETDGAWCVMIGVG